MNDNFFKLNDARTEFIMFGTPHDLKRVTEWTVSVCQEQVLPSTTVINIGHRGDGCQLCSKEFMLFNLEVTKACAMDLAASFDK